MMRLGAEELSLGLRGQWWQGGNEPGMLELVNLMPTRSGLAALPDILPLVLPAESLLQDGHLQWHSVPGSSLLIQGNNLWKMKHGKWVLLWESLPQSEKPWKLIPVGRDWVLLGEYGAVVSKNETIAHYDSPGVTCGDVYMNRLVLGGFDGTEQDYTFAPDVRHINWNAHFDLPENALWYSSPGGDVTRLWKEGALNVLEESEQNSSGMLVIPDIGRIIQILPMRRVLAVYGERGAVLVRAIVEPQPALAVVQGIQLEVELVDALAVCRNRHGQHLIVTREGTLALLDEEEGLKYLGWQEQFSRLTPPIKTFYDPIYNAVYFSDRTLCYVLVEGRLCQSSRVVQSLSRQTHLVGIYDDAPALPEANEFGFLFEALDFGSREYKTINYIEVGYSDLMGYDRWMTGDVQPPEIAVEVRSENGDWISSDWALLNDAGVGYPRMSGVEFRVKMRGTLPNRRGKINSIHVYYDQGGWDRGRARQART
ncbi:MAG TPA: hypothetical protein VLH56_08560 [Dissulfurispiraceae bacterium]|nr:hypothetical protein [Dissulfurispiraceae bacterium]